MDSKYPFAFGYLESAVHRALRELGNESVGPLFEARHILRKALMDLQFNHGIELHWPDDVRGRGDV